MSVLEDSLLLEVSQMNSEITSLIRCQKKFVSILAISISIIKNSIQVFGKAFVLRIETSAGHNRDKIEAVVLKIS